MFPGDDRFNKIIESNFGSFSFQLLPGQIDPHQANTPESLFQVFINVFHGDEAKSAKNVLFIWTVTRPFEHTNGYGHPSTVSYIEISTGSLAGRWPKGFFRNITHDESKKGEVSADGGLQELADKDKNFSFYSRLIQDYGPLRVWYATLDDLNAAALEAGQDRRETIRDWERHIISSYRAIHGVRPLKNRQD
jgi:hypothetical protein